MKKEEAADDDDDAAGFNLSAEFPSSQLSFANASSSSRLKSNCSRGTRSWKISKEKLILRILNFFKTVWSWTKFSWKYCLSFEKWKKTIRSNGDFGKTPRKSHNFRRRSSTEIYFTFAFLLQLVILKRKKSWVKYFNFKKIKFFQISSHLCSHPVDPVLEAFDLPGKSRMRVAGVTNLGLGQTRFFNHFLKTKIGTPNKFHVFFTDIFFFESAFYFN